MVFKIVEMIKLVAVLVIAIPVGYAGLEVTARGNIPLGIGLVSVAISMVLVEKYVVGLDELPVVLVKRKVSSLRNSGKDNN